MGTICESPVGCNNSYSWQFSICIHTYCIRVRAIGKYACGIGRGNEIRTVRGDCFHGIITKPLPGAVRFIAPRRTWFPHKLPTFGYHLRSVQFHENGVVTFQLPLISLRTEIESFCVILIGFIGNGQRIL